MGPCAVTWDVVTWPHVANLSLISCKILHNQNRFASAPLSKIELTCVSGLVVVVVVVRYRARGAACSSPQLGRAAASRQLAMLVRRNTSQPHEAYLLMLLLNTHKPMHLMSSV